MKMKNYAPINEQISVRNLMYDKLLNNMSS